jgi:lipopolysaccharide export LptBFGC system permease protein LptF
MNAVKEQKAPQLFSVFYPVLVTMLALVVWFGFQIASTANTRAQIKQQMANQEPVIQNAEKMRAQLDGIASDTARLARAGNPNAQIIIHELNKRGITVRDQ